MHHEGSVTPAAAATSQFRAFKAGSQSRRLGRRPRARGRRAGPGQASDPRCVLRATHTPQPCSMDTALSDFWIHKVVLRKSVLDHLLTGGSEVQSKLGHSDPLSSHICRDLTPEGRSEQGADFGSVRTEDTRDLALPAAT